MLNSRKKNNYKFSATILLGFLLFGLKEFAELVYHPLQSIIASIGLLLIFGSPFYYKIKIHNPLTGIIKILFNIYICWVLLIITRPFFYGQAYTYDSLHPYQSFGIISYLLPLIVLFGTKVISLPKLFKTVFIFSIIGFVYFVFNFNNMQSAVIRGLTSSVDGQIGLGLLANNYYFWFSISFFSLLCYEFLPIKYQKVAFLTSFFNLFLMAYFARRGGIFMSLLYFLGMLYLYFDKSKKKYFLAKIVLVGLIVYSLIILISSNLSSTFSLLTERLVEDTRSDVDEAIINHLTINNTWFFGEGIEGAYKHPAFDVPRYIHETGYLYLIIKGGMVYLMLYLYLLLHSAYVGFFKTRNRLTKGLAFYSFIHIILLIPYGLPSFCLEYLFVWISFAICESKYLRLLTNEEVKNNFSNHLITK